MSNKQFKPTGKFIIPDKWSVWGYEFERINYEQYIILMEENNREYMKVEGRLAQLNELCTALKFSYTIHKPEKRELFINNSRAGFEYQTYISVTKHNTDGTSTGIASAPGTSVEFWDSSEINFNYAEENAETSAIGRALCFLGFNTGGIDTYERMNRAISAKKTQHTISPQYNQAVKNNNIAPILQKIEEIRLIIGEESYNESITRLGVDLNLISSDMRLATSLLKDMIIKSKQLSS